MCWRDAFNQCLRLCFGIKLLWRPSQIGGRRFKQLKAGLDIFKARVIVTQPFDDVMRGFDVLVGDDQQVDFKPRFHLGDISALFIEKESGDFDRHLGVYGSRVFFH